MTHKTRALLALALLVPAPSVGVLCGMIWFPDTPAGRLIFAASKLWLFALPLLWHTLVDKARVSLSRPKHGGFGIGVLSGLAISGVILLLYAAVGRHLVDRGLMVERLGAVGLASPRPYLIGTAYWVLVNSVLEEYVWRWFCVRKCEALVRPAAAVLLSALFFTLHHVLALQVYVGPVAVAACSVGIFLGGALWSLMYLRYRSVWPGYVSHAIVDLCVFGLGAWLLFGN
jgi:membrane protease YdiL (CAAX protease family)